MWKVVPKQLTARITRDCLKLPGTVVRDNARNGSSEETDSLSAIPCHRLRVQFASRRRVRGCIGGHWLPPHAVVSDIGRERHRRH
jgi:hypothetical protein